MAMNLSKLKEIVKQPGTLPSMGGKELGTIQRLNNKTSPTTFQPYKPSLLPQICYPHLYLSVLAFLGIPSPVNTFS